MKNVLIILAFCMACSEAALDNNAGMAPPADNRFVREILATNLYEPTELAVLPNGDMLFTQRRGAIKRYNAQVGQLEDYDSLPVHFAHEDGLMGLALDPEFDQNNWLYLYYSPVGEKPVQYLSRFSYTPNGLKNEVVVLEVDVQRDECCHTGGSIAFGPGGLLYLSTGDDTNPFESEGFGPMDGRAGRSAWDARRSSANTNDLRGKILRIKPLADGSYSIPAGNLFEDEDPLTRPEIYVMGCRNPYRISVDANRGWLFWGDVGPDAAADQEARGPRGYDEFNIATQPGFFGWPLFVGDNQAYFDYDFASGLSGARYNPNKPVNNSPFNTGLRQLPPAQPARIYYPYANSATFPHLGNGSRNAMAGPVYYSDHYVGRNQFPPFFDGRVFFYDWMRGFIYSLGLDSAGSITHWHPFLADTEFNNLIDMEFGPDGTLYMIEYGTGWFTQNENAQLSRWSYLPGNRPPQLQATLSRQGGAAPLEVAFEASASSDSDGDSLRFVWEINGQEFRQPDLVYTFEKSGIYYPRLTITDSRSNSVTEQFVVEVGNERPQVAVEIAGNKSFFWKGRQVDYRVSATDLEDGTIGQGIDPNEVVFDIQYFQSLDKAEVLGHQRPVSTGETLVNSMDCKSCHKVDEKSIGPSYTEVALRYRGDPSAPAYLVDKIIRGGGGVWGEQAMSAHPDLSKEDGAKIVEYILGLVNTNEFELEGTFVTQETEGRYLFSVEYTDRGKAPLQPVTSTTYNWMRPLRVRAVDFDASEGAQVVEREGGQPVLSEISKGSWIAFENIDLTGIASILVDATGGENARLSIRSGSSQGEVLAQGGLGDLLNLSSSSSHDLHFVFEVPDSDNLTIYSIQFVPNPL